VKAVRDLVRVAGPDAVTFLQGQLSQDIAALDPEAGAAWSLLLQPQGKVDAFVHVRRAGGGEVLLDVDEGWGAAVVERLERFKLRVKADVELLGARELDVPWPVSSGATGWDEWRVAVGFPAMGRELTESTIPEEAGVVDVAVSFTKGCFTGQELVARIDSRGRNVPKRLRRVVVDGVAASAGDELVVDGKAVGTITTAVAGAALAYVRREVEPPAEATLADGRVARIEALPPVT
jgi:folate-binding protein YgfZ